MAYFLGVSGRVDLLIVSQIIPNILGSMISGGAGEILVTKTDADHISKRPFVTYFTFISTALMAAVLFLLTSVFMDDLRMSSVITSLGTLWVSFSFDIGSTLAVFLLMGAGLLMMLLEGKFEYPLRVSQYLTRRPQSPWL